MVFQKENPSHICSAVNWLREPLPLSHHNPELTVTQKHLQSLPEGTHSALPFLDPLWESDEALAISFWLPRKKYTYNHAQSPTPFPHTHQRSEGLQIFLIAQTPALDSLGSSWIRADHHTLAQDDVLLVLCEIPFIALCSGKKPSTFIEVHYKKQPHKTHPSVYCKDSFRGLFITLNSNFLRGPTGSLVSTSGIARLRHLVCFTSWTLQIDPFSLF